MTDLISILLPSRGRPDSYHRMRDSMRLMADRPADIEIVLWLDDNDPSAHLYRRDRTKTTVIQGHRKLLSACWNTCAEEANGQILMHAGDDITFNTPGWDTKVREAFDAIPDRIGLVFGDDLSTNFPDLATHGFLHRRWIQTVGYFLPPLFSSDWNDVWISEVAKQVARLVPLPDVVIEHHHYSFGKAEYDQTHREREQRGTDDDVVNLYKKTANDRASDAAKLRTVMA